MTSQPQREISVIEWFITLFIIALPVLNIIFLMYWSFFSAQTPKSKRNFCKAVLVFMGLCVLLVSFLLPIYIRFLQQSGYV